MFIQAWSLRGSTHRKNNKPNQDSVSCNQTNRFFVISVADGVGSCASAYEGALLAARCATETLSENGAVSAELLLGAVAETLKKQSEMTQRPLPDFSSTLASVVLDQQKNSLFYLSLGDSLLLTVSSGSRKCRILSAPCDSTDGIPTTTHRNPAFYTQSGMIAADDIETVLILTDGAWRPMFSRMKMRRELQDAIENGDFAYILSFLEKADVSDDASVAILSRHSCQSAV